MSILIERLRDEQQARCAYGTRDGDGRTCDCKFGAATFGLPGEITGCPELRTAISLLMLTKDKVDDGCPTCSWPSRETVGLVCQTCGKDYGSRQGNSDD